MAISTNNGLVNGPVHNLLIHFFTPGSSKIKVFETCFFDVVTTQYDHPSYVKHVLGRIYVFFSLFGYWVGGGGPPKGLVHNLLVQCNRHPGQMLNAIVSPRTRGPWRGELPPTLSIASDPSTPQAEPLALLR